MIHVILSEKCPASSMYLQDCSESFETEFLKNEAIFQFQLIVTPFLITRQRTHRSRSHASENFPSQVKAHWDCILLRHWIMKKSATALLQRNRRCRTRRHRTCADRRSPRLPRSSWRLLRRRKLKVRGFTGTAAGSPALRSILQVRGHASHVKLMTRRSDEGIGLFPKG